MLSAWSWPALSTTNLPYPSISPVADRWNVRSVTFTSGMIATLRAKMPFSSSSRLSVTTSFSTYQSTKVQIHRTTTKMQK